MKIHKVINNNVVSILDDKQNEVVVMGRGIAFKKKIGDELDEALIDKRFYMKNENDTHKFMQILNDIPMEHIELTSDIIDYAKYSLEKKFNDSLTISLCDHIYMAIQRYLDGITLKNPMLWEIQRFYEAEYEVGLHALEMIEERFKIKLPEDEAGFITIHLVDAEMDNCTIENVYTITKVIQDISNIVRHFFGMEFDTKSVYYYRFITHIRFFAQRLVLKTLYSDSEDDGLFNIIKVKYPNAYECVLKINAYVQNNFNYHLTDDEMLYLMIHIERIVYKTNA